MGCSSLGWRRGSPRLVSSAASFGRQTAPRTQMKRYEVHWARLDPVLGSEIGKTRPCVIVSDERYNAALPTVVVYPLSSTVRPRWRSRVQIMCAGRAADVCMEQIRTISQQRLAGRLGVLRATEASAVRRVITEMYGQP